MGSAAGVGETLLSVIAEGSGVPRAGVGMRCVAFSASCVIAVAPEDDPAVAVFFSIRDDAAIRYRAMSPRLSTHEQRKVMRLCSSHRFV